MKQNNSQNIPAYSIIVAILMIGFLLILTTWTLNLVLQEMQDGKWRQDYMKAYAAAEWSMELALYRIKDEWYGYDGSIDGVEIFGTANTNAKISYDFDSQVSAYSWVLPPYQSDIIPLFWIDDTWAPHYAVAPIFSASSDVIWNIITPSWWISGKGNFSHTDSVREKDLNATQKLEYNTVLISSLLSWWENYLIVYNPNSTSQSYTLQKDFWEDFTKPRADIYSTARVGKYTQNIKTTVDNTEFLGILKYSIYSWN